MNAFLLIPTDTLAISDSIVVKVMNVTGTCQPIIKEAETNWQDVTIVFFICAAIVVIATYGICRFFTYKIKEQEDQKAKENLKHNWDVEEKERKQKADQTNRDWQHEDEERKQKAEELKRSWQHEDENRKQKENLMNRKLEILHELCFETDAETTQKVLKKYDSVEIKNYFEALTNPQKVEPIKDKESNG